MVPKRIVVVLLGWGLALGSCGDDDEPGGGTGIAFEDMPQQVAGAICAAYQACFGELTELMLAGEDCQQVFERSFANGAFEAMSEAVANGTAIYHADKMQACLDALAAQGCDALGNNSLPECQEALEGTVAEGGGCTNGVECVGDLFCQTDAGCPGTCTARGGAGAGCDEDGHCQDGLRCDTVSGTCATPVADGGACGGGTGDECGAGLLCMGDDEATSTPGTCEPAAELLVGQVGASCDLTAGPWCEPDAHCAVVDFSPPDTLVAECMVTAASGGPCHPAAPDMCPTGEYCAVVPQTLDGTCEPLPQAGDACADSWSKQCDLYHRCVDGICHALADNGASCPDDAACYSGSCNNGVCGPDDPC